MGKYKNKIKTKTLICLIDIDLRFKKNASFYLDPDEWLILTLERIDDNSAQPFKKFYIINGTSVDTEIELVSGKYKVEATMFMNYGPNATRNELYIPADRRCEGGLLGTSIGEECVDIPEFRHNETFPDGGLLLSNATSGYVEITSDDLNNEYITVYVVGVNNDHFSKLEDLQQMQAHLDYSTTERNALLPKFD